MTETCPSMLHLVKAHWQESDKHPHFDGVLSAPYDGLNADVESTRQKIDSSLRVVMTTDVPKSRWVDILDCHGPILA